MSNVAGSRRRATFPRGATEDDSLRQFKDATNALFRELADGERVFFLDINDQFLIDDGALPQEIMPDLLHPSEGGYALWAKAVEPTVAEFRAEKKRTRRDPTPV